MESKKTSTHFSISWLYLKQEGTRWTLYCTLSSREKIEQLHYTCRLNQPIHWQITHLAQERLDTPLGSTSPSPLKQWCGFFHIPQEPDKKNCCETGPTVFHPYPRILESLAICRVVSLRHSKVIQGLYQLYYS